MSYFFIDTPFDNFLIFDTGKRNIQKITFKSQKIGLPVSGRIKQLMLDVFKNRDLSLFDYSLIDFDKTKKSYKLYEFLINTKTGETLSYSEAAKSLFNSANYARAVASMLHANPFVFLIPCHRIVAKNSIGGYGGGVDLKIKILNWENALLKNNKGV